MDNLAAILGDPGREEEFGVYANHTDMVRFWGKKDTNYDVVAGELDMSVHQIVVQAESR